MKTDGVRYTKWYNKIYSHEGGRWALSAVVSFLILIVVFLLIRPVFMTIDDTRLQYVYAGYASGQPEAVYLFSYYPLSWALSQLYTFFPGVYWYALYQYVAIGFSSMLIGKTIYKIGFRTGRRQWVSVAVHILLYLSVALISTILMHFEVTGAMLGAAGVILLMGVDPEHDSRTKRLFDFILSGMCLVACFIVQFNSFYAACCYLLVALAVAFLRGVQNKQIKAMLLRFGCYLVGITLAVTAVVALERHVKDTDQWQEYLSYNKYRVSFWDYPHLTYAEDPELFEEMGWTEQFYDLSEQMYFMDARFDQESLKQFTTEFSWFDFSDPEEMVSTLQTTLKQLFQTERLAVIQAIMLCLLTGVGLISIFRIRGGTKRYYPQWIGIVCCFGGTVLLVLFLGAKGRLPLRAWLAFMIPCILSIAFQLWTIPPASSGKEQRKTLFAGRKKWQMAAVLLAMCTWLGGMTWAYQEIIGADWKGRNKSNESVKQMENYVMAHPENVYVYDRGSAGNYSVFTSYPDAEHRPTNAFVWGSSYLYTPVYERQLEQCGRTQLLTEDLFDENVYFIGYTKGNYGDLLYQMLSKEYASVEMQAVDYIGEDYIVYKIYN